MSMTQLVIGAALGFIVAQGVLLGIRQLIGWVRLGSVREQLRALTPASGQAIIDGFIKYAAPLGISAALMTLGVWAVSDFLNAKSVHTEVTASAVDPQTAAPESPARGSPARGSPARESSEEAPKPASVPAAVSVAVAASSVHDPYADPDFKVHRPHRARSALSLKETILERSEAKARDELLLETQQHANRSQYDCEAADRADKYLKAGLDVWGFAAWQVKHFPPEAYRGATLRQCKDVKDVLADSPRVELQSTVAQRNH